MRDSAVKLSKASSVHFCLKITNSSIKKREHAAALASLATLVCQIRNIWKHGELWKYYHNLSSCQTIKISGDKQKSFHQSKTFLADLDIHLKHTIGKYGMLGCMTYAFIIFTNDKCVIQHFNFYSFCRFYGTINMSQQQSITKFMTRRSARGESKTR